MAGIYIHIPFCRSKCAYCDFYSSAAKGDMERYVEAIVAELQVRREEISEPVRTLYLGGGTPSLLPLQLLDELLGCVNAIFPLTEMDEITLEANPEDISDASLSAYRQVGVNRISIGIQSFSSQNLKAIGRQHSAADSRKALEVLAASGINYSADLIYGLPEQGLIQWKEELRELLDYRPPHFSSYLLSYEPGTKLFVRLQRGELQETSEQLARDMYDSLCSIAAERRYEHYEISNFAMPGAYSRHNTAYWDYTPYLGLGAAAHSFDGVNRRINPASIKKYVDGVASGGGAFIIEEETEENRLNDYIITSLRTRRGLQAEFTARRFSRQLVDELFSNARRQELAGNLIATPDGWAIPENRWLTADSILRELIV